MYGLKRVISNTSVMPQKECVCVCVCVYVGEFTDHFSELTFIL
jgi:hypothetical protein